MRRFVAVVLLALFVVQSSGGAMAATPAQPGILPISTVVLLRLQQAYQRFTGTEVGATLTGHLSRYQAIHAPPPHFPSLQRGFVRADAPTPAIARIERRGVAIRPPQLPSEAASYAQRSVQDPLTHRKPGPSAMIRERGIVPSAPVRLLAAKTNGASNSQSPPPPGGQPFMSVSPSTLSGPAGGGDTVTASCTYNGAPVPCGTITSSSSNDAVATSNSTSVHYVAPGSAQITFVGQPDGFKAYAYVPVTVYATPTPPPTPTPTPTATPFPTATPPTTPTPLPSGSPQPGPTSGTGITPWWTYTSGTIGGIGNYLVNVGTGNLLIQATDVRFSERGIDLEFTRTYNSQSRHGSQNSDGTGVGVFGNRWTNNFDQRLVYTSNGPNPVISFYDATGARFDYTSYTNNQWTPPPGMAGTTLKYDGSCKYFLTLKDGTRLYFYSPQWDTCENLPQAALDGRLWRLEGRNHSNYIELDYSFVNGDASTLSNLTQIAANHVDGHTLTLTFAPVGSGGPTELQNIEVPKGGTIDYGFASHGALTSVQRIGAGSPIYEDYLIDTNDQIKQVQTPNYVDSYNQTGGNPVAGDTVNFTYDSSGDPTQIEHVGVEDINPNDTTGTNLYGDTGTVAPTNWLTEVYSGWGTTLTQMSDSLGHASAWEIDASGRPTQEQDWANSAQAGWFVTDYTWDVGVPSPNNDLTEIEDLRGGLTDAAYDTNGNVVAIASPSNGSFRPTSLITYDTGAVGQNENGVNNVIAYCDPVQTHAMGDDWSSGPPSVTCPKGAGATQLTWDYSDINEPYGRLASMVDANNTFTTTAASYDSHGEVTSLIGTNYAQRDGTTMEPSISLTYDGRGNVLQKSVWLDSSHTALWQTTYDANTNLPITQTDPDNVTDYLGYYDDGALQCTTTAYQYSLDNASCGAHAVQYGYDSDGNLVSETHHYGGGSPGVTARYYDAVDRLVEVGLPSDPTDYYPTIPWLTRYLYDLNGASAPDQINNVNQSTGAKTPAYSYYAYGGLYATQRYLPLEGKTSPGQWEDVSGTQYDPLGRPLQQYRLQPGQNFEADKYTWDSAGLGWLGTIENAMQDSVVFAYDGDGDVLSRNYGKGTDEPAVPPWETMTYDADGRMLTYQNEAIANSATTEAKVGYDADGNVTDYVEPSGGAGMGFQSGEDGKVSCPATFAYSQYPGGRSSGFTVSASCLPAYTRQYSYRGDGAVTTESTAYNGGGGPFTATYTNAGRVLTRDDMFSSGHGYHALQVAYNAYGQITGNIAQGGYALPVGLYGDFGYDPEGDVTGYVSFLNDNDKTSNTWTSAYSSRGELVKETAGSNTILSQQSADGYMVSSNTPEFDPRVGTQASGYDLDGRQAGNSYDPFNRVIQDYTTGGGSVYDYGIGTLPFQGIYAGTEYTQHSGLGTEPIFTTDGSGAIQDVKLSNSSEIFPKDPQYQGLTIYDRDMFGFAASIRTSAGPDIHSWTAPNPYSTCDNSNNLGAPAGELPGPKTITKVAQCEGPELLTYAFRNDGYFDQVLTFRGARAYSGTSQQWITPDAYAGDQSNPLSALAYNYAKNNPLRFADPSGFDATSDCVVGSTDPKTGLTTISCETSSPSQSFDPYDLNAILGMYSSPVGTYPWDYPIGPPKLFHIGYKFYCDQYPCMNPMPKECISLQQEFATAASEAGAAADNLTPSLSDAADHVRSIQPTVERDIPVANGIVLFEAFSEQREFGVAVEESARRLRQYRSNCP